MYTNNTGIPLSLAVWLCTDDYDHSNNPDEISATTLLQPIRAIALARQTLTTSQSEDIETLIPSRIGTALHTAIEVTWKDPENVAQALASLGYPENIINRIKINPTPEELTEDSIAVYMELRTKKQIGKFIISGKFDFVIDGTLEDFKSTSAYNYIYGSNKEKYMQQGSIYKWLNPEIITEDYMKIQYIFTDWSAIKAKQDKQYPNKRLLEQKLHLMSLTQTEMFITDILTKVEALANVPQEQFPLCTKEELWQQDSVWKYYKNPNNKTRSTKNFSTEAEAFTQLAADNFVGEVICVPGEVRRCKYCKSKHICTQAAELISNGLLVI